MARRRLQWIIMVAIFTVVGLAMCKLVTPRTEFGNPLSTMESFKRAIHRKNWKQASECLSEKIRRENLESLEKPELYSLHYWTSSRGFESLLVGLPPLIERDVTFKAIRQDDRRTEIEFVYPRALGKTVRLNRIDLEVDDSGQ